MNAIEMPKYRSHKTVHALKIKFIDGNTIAFDNERFAPMEVDPLMFARGRPTPGDYLVVYDDNYKSFSPAKAFEDGYTLVPSPTHKE